jgi:uncharacterized repeat protein (TIGR03803 family)
METRVFALCATMVIALPAQTFTTLLSFDGTNGATPKAGLIQATNGGLYGTTQGHGADDGGTIFKITPSGTLTTLYNFCSESGCTDGRNPWTGLVQGTDGDFYGTTLYGGAYGNGTAFKITPSGTLTTLYSFCAQSQRTGGERPQAPLVQATNGDFYGTTNKGGTADYGTVFSPSVGLGPFVETRRLPPAKWEKSSRSWRPI